MMGSLVPQAPLNILLIVTDQHRWDALSAYGNPLCPTPNIDRLAREGVRFDSAFTCTALCGPVRASLFTGLMPHNYGVVGNSEKHSKMLQVADVAPDVKGLTHYLAPFGSSRRASSCTTRRTASP